MRALRLALPALLFLAGCAPGDPAASYRRGDYAAAAAGYRRAVAAAPGSPVAHYGLGSTLLRLEEFEAARPHLEIATRAPGAELRQWAYYNLGNSYLEPAFLGRDEAGSADHLVRAISAYKRALLLDPDDAEAKWNLELARLLLRRPPQAPSPRHDPRAGGGGEGGGGGGGGTDPQRGRMDPRPQSGGGAGPSPQVTRERAEELLAEAEQRELGIQREKLRRPQPRSPTAH